MKASDLRLAVQPSLRVDFRTGPDGVLTHLPGPSPVLFSLEMSYRSATDLAQIQQSVRQRKVVDPRGKMKALVPDAREGMKAVVREVVTGWQGMTVAGARALEAELALGKRLASEAIPFDPEMLDLFVEKSNLAGLVLVCIQDYSFWFPDETSEEATAKGQLGN